MGTPPFPLGLLREQTISPRSSSQADAVPRLTERAYSTMADDPRPPSGLRGRATRRGKEASAAEAAKDGEPVDEDEGGEMPSWKVELESIMSGTHATLVEALEPHDTKMKAIVGAADRVRQLQMVNINALFDCEKKQADDENKVRLRARARLTCLACLIVSSRSRLTRVPFAPPARTRRRSLSSSRLG